MKKETRKRLAWMISFVMLLGCVCNAGAVRGAVRTAASSGFKDISTDTKSGPGASAPVEATEWEPIAPSEITDRDVYYKDMEVVTYKVRAAGKEVVVSEEIVKKLAKIFDTEELPRNWKEKGEITFDDNGLKVITTREDEKKRTIIVEEGGVIKRYEAVISDKNENGSIEIGIQNEKKNENESAGPEYVVSVSGDAVSVTRNDRNGTWITVKKKEEKEQELYDLVIDKTWAEEKKFELAKEVKEIESTSTPTVAPTYTPTEPSTSTPTATSTETPTNIPTNTPAVTPTNTPIETPMITSTATPTEVPTEIPTEAPTETPTEVPTITPVSTPINTPTVIPTSIPTEGPKKYEKAIGQSINVKKEYGKKSEISDWSKYKKYISVNKKKGTIQIEKYKKGEIKVGVSVGKRKQVLSIKIKRPKAKITISKDRKTVKATFSNVGKAKKVILQFYSKKKKKYVAPTFFSKCFKKKGGKYRDPTKLGKIKYRLCVIYNKKKSYSKPVTK